MRSSRSAGDVPSRRRRPYSPWSGSPSRHSAAQMIVPPGPHDLGRRGHPLDRLVEVLVERIPAVGGDHEVEWRGDRPHGVDPGRRAGVRVHRQDRPGERPGDPLLVVQQDIEGEVDPGRRGDRPDGIMHRIAVDDSPGRPRVADPPGVVQFEGRLETGEARRDHLGPAAEPGEEVRFDETRGDAHIRLDPLPRQADRDVSDHAEADQAVGVAGVVIHDPPRARTSAPSIASRSSAELDRCVPVAIRTTTSAGRMMPSRASITALSMRVRGCGRVTSQTEIATRWPRRTRPRNGDPTTGCEMASRRVAAGSGAAARGVA